MEDSAHDNFQNPSTHKIFRKLLIKHASGRWWTVSFHLSSSLFSPASTCSGTWPQIGRHSGSRRLGGRCSETRPACRRAAGNALDLLALRGCRSHGTPYTPPGEVCGGGYLDLEIFITYYYMFQHRKGLTLPQNGIFIHLETNSVEPKASEKQPSFSSG